MYKVLNCVLGVNPVRLESMRRLARGYPNIRVMQGLFFTNIFNKLRNYQITSGDSSALNTKIRLKITLKNLNVDVG